uniref:Uncharacterized protein n=1 Tax=Clytia hemisphaerica TaxID=252671 RepID=A0A7M5WL06_9CNID
MKNLSFYILFLDQKKMLDHLLKISFLLLVRFPYPSSSEVYNCYKCTSVVEECDNMADCITSCTRQQEIEPCPYLHFECFNVSFSYIEEKTKKKKFWFERHCAPNFENDCGGEFACALADHVNSTDCKKQCCNDKDLCNTNIRLPSIAALSSSSNLHSSRGGIVVTLLLVAISFVILSADRDVT